jgi:alkylation response protein AidB-like acyl-CoA dehydrogenase
MDFESSEDGLFRQEIRQFLQTDLPPDTLEQCRQIAGLVSAATEEPKPVIREVARKLATKGWLALGLPKEYGGVESPLKRLIFEHELSYQGLPPLCSDMGIGGLSVIIPVIRELGTEEQKRRHIPPTSAGERFWCMLYSEPSAGSDLASLQCRAKANNGDYIVDGPKIWTSAAQLADWGWLTVRTGAPESGRRGISVLLVDMKTPGITIRPLQGMGGGYHFNEVFFDGTRIPKENLLGEENHCWDWMMSALDLERAGQAATAMGRAKGTLEKLAHYIREAPFIERSSGGYRITRHKLAEIAVQTEVGWLLVYHAAFMQSKGTSFSYEASTAKAYAAALTRRLGSVIVEIVGLYGQLGKSSNWAPLSGSAQSAYLNSLAATIMGGTLEIEHNIIATKGLGLPR